MNVAIITKYLILSLILFFILNYLDEKNKENPINRIIISLIYITIISGLILKEFIFMILIFEFLIRIFYTNYVLERDFFKETNSYIKEYIITIILGYLLNIYFINKVDSVFLSIEEFKIIIWLFIIIFSYLFMKDNLKISIKTKRKNNEYRNKEYNIILYAKLKNKYSDIIKTKYKELLPLIYSIMIYNDTNHPKIFRKLDIIRFRIDNEERKFGIMQITSKKIITDEESIELGIKKIEKIYLKYNKDKKIKLEDIILMVLNNYYEDQFISKEIQNIYTKIIEFNEK